MQPSVSPDGRFVAFQSDESGTYEISVVEVATGSLSPISTGGGLSPMWSPAGNEIFYNWQGMQYTVDVRTEPAFSASAPRQLFGPFFVRGEFDVSADGQRFLIALAGGAEQGTEAGQQGRFNVILNWFEDLERRVPSGR